MDNQFKFLLQEWREQIDRRLFQVLDGHHPAILYDPIQYVLEGGGKRIRPILLALSCKAVDGVLEKCWDAAVAVELLHDFTLVHDDTMDRDDTRRGRATVHKKWNSDIALLAGDGLVALAFQSLLRTQSSKIHEIATVFTEGIIELCEGQAFDLEFETNGDVNLKDYLDMIGRKTARLLNVSAKLGGLIGNGNEAEVQALGNFGYNLGCGFQIQDDLLDITSDEATMGKTYGSDVKRKKQTYLLVHALSEADSSIKEQLRFLLTKQEINRTQINEVKVLFEKAGSIDAAKFAINKYILSAKSNLDELHSTQGKELLLSFLKYISNRNA